MRKNENWNLPIFWGIRHGLPINGSKLEGIMQGRTIYISQRTNNWEWMVELMARFIRRKRVLVAFLPELCSIIQRRYPANSNTLERHIQANAYSDTGVLYVDCNNKIRASCEHTEFNDVVHLAAQYRQKKLDAMRSKPKKTDPTGEALEARILAWETEAVIKNLRWWRERKAIEAKHLAKIEKRRIENE